MKSFFIALMSIFFDISTFGEDRKNYFCPQDLTEHYKNEIKEFKLDGVYIGAHYIDIRENIEAYKYRSDRQYIWQYVEILSKVVEKYVDKNNGNPVLVGVPMHWTRYMIRWFNHIDSLVSGLSKNISIPVKKPLYAFFTQRQSKLSKIKRMQNRDHAFWLRKWVILPETVILVDDIVSTGSTANACAKILKEAWVKKVYGVFIASNQ